MTGKPSYTPAEILDMGRRAEFEGNLEYATQFYTYLIESLPGTREANDALVGMERVAQLRNKTAAAPPPRQTTYPMPESHAPQAAPPPQSQPAVRYSQDEVPRSGPATSPRLSMNGTAKAASPPQGVPHERPEPALTVPLPPQQGGHAAPRSAAPASPQQHPTGQPPHQRGGSPPQAHWNPVSLSDPHADEKTPLPKVMQRTEDSDDEVEFVPGYRLGRFLAFVVILFGWLAMFGGIAFAALAVAGFAGTNPVPEFAALPLGVLIGFTAFLGGLLMIFLGSLAQASFEAANNTRELLEIERAREGW